MYMYIDVEIERFRVYLIKRQPYYRKILKTNFSFCFEFDRTKLEILKNNLFPSTAHGS